MTSAWSYRLRVLVMPADAEIVLGLAGENVFGRELLAGAERAVMGQPRGIRFRQRGFETEDKAWTAAEEFRGALRLAAFSEGIGLEAGDVPATGGVTRAFAQQLVKQDGVARINRNVGIQVFPDADEVREVSMSAGLNVGTVEERTQRLREAFRSVKPRRERGENLSVALDLYLISSFEVSARSEFLHLMMVLESLARPHASEEARKLVQSFIDTVKRTPDDGFDDGELQSLRSSLEYVQRGSISRGIQRLLRGIGCSDEQLKAFKKSYDLRSKLVHEGRHSRGDEVRQAIPTLRDLAMKAISWRREAGEAEEDPET